MKTSDFYYNLPHELIAQTPLEPRDSSRLLVLDRHTGAIEHKHFYDIIDYLHKGDLLVLNNSRVIPARLYGERTDTGYPIELLLLEQLGSNRFETLVKPGKKLREGAQITFLQGLTATITAVNDNGNRIVEFHIPSGETIYTMLDRVGQMPLPPYITEKLTDKERYQTVYSKDNGSSAAPTAGLHFTTDLLDRIRAKGVNVAEVTLHVGLGTFRPVKVEDVQSHEMHSEHYSVNDETAATINGTRAAGGRVIAVGTTSCRTIESVATFQGGIVPCNGDTNIFIYPSYEFKIMDGLVTNFHLPESTLIMLVSAFCGFDNTMNAYKKAVEEQYRFFSFGDAMLIL